MKADGSICTSPDPCPCDSNGACTCGIGYIGNKCDECKSGYFDLDGNDSDSDARCTGEYCLLNLVYTRYILFHN